MVRIVSTERLKGIKCENHEKSRENHKGVIINITTKGEGVIITSVTSPRKSVELSVQELKYRIGENRTSGSLRGYKV